MNAALADRFDGRVPRQRRWTVDGRLCALGRWIGACSLLLAVGACGDEAPVSHEPAFTAVAVLDGSSPGRSIWVRVLDRDAQPIEGASVSIRLGPDSVREATELEGGEHRLDGLIDGVVPIAVDVAGRRHMLEHPVENAYATLVLPVGGRLDIVWQVPQLAGLPDGDLYLVVVARLDPELRLETELDVDEGYTGRVTLPYLLPGQYLASLELWRLPEDADLDALAAEVGTERAQTPSETSESPVKILPLTQPRLLWIEEGEATQVVLGSPTLADGEGAPADAR